MSPGNNSIPANKNDHRYCVNGSEEPAKLAQSFSSPLPTAIPAIPAPAPVKIERNMETAIRFVTGTLCRK